MGTLGVSCGRAWDTPDMSILILLGLLRHEAWRTCELFRLRCAMVKFKRHGCVQPPLDPCPFSPWFSSLPVVSMIYSISVQQIPFLYKLARAVLTIKTLWLTPSPVPGQSKYPHSHGLLVMTAAHCQRLTNLELSQEPGQWFQSGDALLVTIHSQIPFDHLLCAQCWLGAKTRYWEQWGPAIPTALVFYALREGWGK